MKGFVRNESGRSVHRAQRSFPVNGSVSFESLYVSFGEQSGVSEGPKFVEWLRERFFSGEGWSFYNEDGSPFFEEKDPAELDAAVTDHSVPVDGVVTGTVEKKSSRKKSPAKKKAAKKKAAKKDPGKGAGRKLRRDNTNKVQASQIDAGAIINAELVQAKDMIEKTNDRSVLKRALTLSNHLSQKEDHRRLIQRRLEQVYN